MAREREEPMTPAELVAKIEEIRTLVDLEDSTNGRDN